jgi:hypothetical protein
MSSIAVSLIVFGCIVGGVIFGLVLQRILPKPHLSPESKDVVKLSMGLTASTSALVLGLLVASAKSAYDAQRGEVTELSAKIILLNRALAQYGPEAHEARDMLRRMVANFIDQTWPKEGSAGLKVDPGAPGPASLYGRLQELPAGNEMQRSLKSTALSIVVDMGKTRWLLFEQRGSSIPTVFLIVLMFWLSVLFASFSLFAPRNATVTAVLIVCALSVSSAIFLILEMDRPFEGVIQISDHPLRVALAQLGH